MPVDRFFLPSLFEEGQEAILEEGEFHHLAHVLRISAGEQVELVNGKGQLALGKVAHIQKKRAQILIQEVASRPPPKTSVILAQALPRLNRLEFIVEKGTELGMTHLWLFPGKRSEKHALTENQLERLRGISISAMKQCGRLYLPEITLHPSMPKPEGHLALFGDLEHEAPDFPGNISKTFDRIICYIGPESGFSPEEIKQLRDWGVKGIRLHSNILRTDTAAITALALISWMKAKGKDEGIGKG